MQDSPCGHLPRWRRFGKTRPVPVPVPGTGSPDPKNKMQPARVCQFFPVPWYYFPAEKSGIIFPAFSSVIKKTSVSPSSRRRAGSGWVNRIDPRRNPNSRMPKRSFRSSSAMVFPSAGDPAFHPDRVDMRCLEKRLEILYFLVLVRVGAPGKEGGPEAFCPFDDPRDLLVRDLVAF